MHKEFRFLLILAILVMPLIACENFSRWRVAGNYVSEKNAKNYMELKSNGSFYVHENGMGAAGSYEVDGDQVTLKTDLGLATRGKIDGKTLVDDDGDRWTKQ